MVHTHFQDHETSGSEEEEFWKRIDRIWEWAAIFLKGEKLFFLYKICLPRQGRETYGFSPCARPSVYLFECPSQNCVRFRN